MTPLESTGTPATGLTALACMITAAVLLLWWQLHQIGMSWRELRRIMRAPKPGETKLNGAEGLDISLWIAPQLQEGSYRDDTGTWQEARR